MSRDRDEAFKRLFGEAFAEAYEQQLDRLKAAARAQGTKMKNDSGRAS